MDPHQRFCRNTRLLGIWKGGRGSRPAQMGQTTNKEVYIRQRRARATCQTISPDPGRSLRNYAACHGARGATNPTTNESGASELRCRIPSSGRFGSV